MPYPLERDIRLFMDYSRVVSTHVVTVSKVKSFWENLETRKRLVLVGQNRFFSYEDCVSMNCVKKVNEMRGEEFEIGGMVVVVSLSSLPRGSFLFGRKVFNYCP